MPPPASASARTISRTWPAPAFRNEGDRIELGLDTAPVRERWRQQFDIPLEATQAMLQRQGARVMALSTIDASDAWLSLLGQPHAGVATGAAR